MHIYIVSFSFLVTAAFLIHYAFLFYSSFPFLRYLMDGTNSDGDAAPALPLCSECSSFDQNSSFPFRYRLVLYLRCLMGGVG